MSTPPRALLFDFDGTLADSLALLLGAFRHTFTVHMGVVPPEAEWIAGIGTPLESQMRGFVPDDALVPALVATYRAWQHEHHDILLAEFDGARETLALLHRHGHPTALVTSKGVELARRGLRRLALDPFIDEVIGVESTERHKPHPDPVHLALVRLGAAASHALFLGDSPHDIAAGNAAGVVTVAALWGPFSRAQLEAAHPHHLLDDIRGLPGVIRDLDRPPDQPASRNPAR